MGACISNKREKNKITQNVIEKSIIINYINESKIINDSKQNDKMSNTVQFPDKIINKQIKEEEKEINNIESDNINIIKSEEQNKDIKKYYLVCPICNCHTTYIDKIYYNNNVKQILIKYSCICNGNSLDMKEISLINILSNKEPINNCKIHLNNKLIIYCKTCKRTICSLCIEEKHKDHKLYNNIIDKPINKEDINKFLDIIKEKEQQFIIRTDKNTQNIQNGKGIEVKKLNETKLNLNKLLEDCEGNNPKTLGFLIKLYKTVINNLENTNEFNKYINTDNNDINSKNLLLTNHINNYSVKNNDISKLRSDIGEHLDIYNDKNINSKINEDYDFQGINELSKKNISKNDINNNQNEKEFTCIKTLKGHNEKIVSLIESSSGKLISGSYDNTIRIWDINSGKEDFIIKEKGKVFCLLEFEKNKILSGKNDNLITLWDLDSSYGNYVYDYIGHELWVNCLVKCDINHFASASNDTKIKIWNFYNKKCITTLTGHLDCVLALTLLKNKNLCSGGADITLKIWDWEEKICLSTLKGHNKWVKCIFELNNNVILSGSDDNTIKVWKDYINIKTLKKHTHSVRTLCQINNYYFASGSFDCSIIIWEIKTWKCIQTLVGHNSNIISLISLEYKNKSNNNYYNTIASCSNDKTIKIWEGNI